MRKLKFLLTCLLMASISLVSAQTKTASGTVIAAENGEPIIGASVIVKGSSQGKITDANGKFTIPVPSNATLVISYVGMVSQEVSPGTNMEIVLLTDTKTLDEVVITAMGITRDKKAIGYSSTSVSGEDIADKRTSDVMSSLSGKVAGVQISSSSTDPGASNSVIIRGITSLTPGKNQPLYVVDGVPLNNSAVYSSDELNNGYDFGNGANAVNPDDVANMTILKGAAATALYGSRAAAGVILITTKKGKSQKKGLGIEYNGGVQFESVLRILEMQNEFGMGWNGSHTLKENGSWGPRFDGSKQLWGQVYNNSQRIKSYVAIPDNLKDFFDTGLRYSNSISLNGGTDKSDYFVSFSQLSDNGILPTDADTYDKYTFSARGSHKIDKLTLSTSVNYSNQKNNFSTTGQGFSMINSLYQTPRDVSLIGLSDLSNPFNTPGYYYTPYGVTNPYYSLENNLSVYNAQRFYGKIQLDYDILKYLKATYRLGYDETQSKQELGAPNLKSLYAGTPNASGNLEKEEGSYSQSRAQRREINQDFLLNSNNNFDNFGVNILAGLNVNERKFSSFESAIKGLDIPTWYNLSNSASTPVTSQDESLRRLIGLFGQVDLSWRNMLYLTLTARNDWSSTLPVGNNDFFYPGVTASWAFTETFPVLNNWLTFGKLRAAYGKTGNDADPYMIYPVFAQSSADASGWGKLSFPIGGVNAFTQGNVLGNVNLSPEITTEFEFGTNLIFFNGRISLDASYYNRNSDKQIFSLNMDPATGYTAQNMNLGKIQNKGVELLLSVQPIKTKDITWEITANYTKNKSKVISLPEELGGKSMIYGFTGGTAMWAIVGEPVGVFKAEVPAKDPNGNTIVDASTGIPVPADEYAEIGDMNYKYEMGLGTSVRYKSVTLGVDFDIRQGGIMYSRTKDINTFTGNAIHTTYNDRNTFIVPNSVNKVTDSKGNVSYVENITPVAYDLITDFWGKYSGFDLGSSNLIDKSYVKLRSVILSWDLPNSWFAKTPLNGIKLSAYGNNLFVWTPADNTFIDPEMTSFGNDLSGKFGEYTANPTSRKYGFNLTVKF